MVKAKTPKQIAAKIRKLEKEISGLKALKKGVIKVKKMGTSVSRIENPRKKKKASKKKAPAKRKAPKKRARKKRK